MIAVRRLPRWAFLGLVCGLAGCGAPSDSLNAVSRAELDRRLSEATGEKERRLLGIQIVEREISDADARTGSARSRLKEALAKEQVVALQLAERLARLQTLEEDLSAAKKRIRDVEGEVEGLAAREKELGLARERRAAVAAELSTLERELAQRETLLQTKRSNAESEVRRLEAEITRMAKAGEVALAALSMTQQLMQPAPGTASQPSSAATASRPATAER